MLVQIKISIESYDCLPLHNLLTARKQIRQAVWHRILNIIDYRLYMLCLWLLHAIVLYVIFILFVFKCSTYKSVPALVKQRLAGMAM